MTFLKFWLSFNNFEEKLQLPINPESHKLKTGNKNDTVDIVDLGELSLIGGEKLAEIELTSFFPFRYAPYCAYRDIPKPYDAVALIEKWRKAKQPIRLIVTDTPINLQFSIESFEYGERDGTKDVYYTLSLREYRYIQVRKVSSSSLSIQSTAAARPDPRPVSRSYTVKSGDSLWLITKKEGGSDWNVLYNANKGVIGANPNLIYPGQTLVIPWAT